MFENLNDSLAKTCKDLMLDEPFYGLFLITLNKEFSEKIPTAGVSLDGINYKLYINKEFWKDLSPNHRKGLLKHELLHIAFCHLTDFQYLTDKQLANIAMDLEINQYINSDILPEGGQTLDLYPELKLEARAGTNYYYEQLQKAAKDKSCPNLNDMLKGMSEGQTIVTVKVKGQSQEAGVPDHSSWDNEDLDEATKRVVRNQVQHVLTEIKEQIIRSRGVIPGEMASLLESLENAEPPKFDWKSYLRRFAGGSIKVYTKKTRRKYNKRYEDNPGLKIKHKKHILVAIDTSGSVSDDELKEFMHEIYHIHKTGADVTVIHADTAIQKIEPFKVNDNFKVYGRGGTSFDPVVEYYNENVNKYTCLIYATDGEAPAPEENPKGRVLWVLSSTSTETDHLPGITIKLN